MTRSAKGTLEAPGTNVRQKAGLNQGILANGWGQLVARMEDKAPDRVRKIDPRYTSQTCNACGHIARESRESQALFLCVACKHRDHADVNAAKNLRDTAAGHCGGCAGRLAVGRAGEPRTSTRPPPCGVVAVGIPCPSGRGGCQHADPGSTARMGRCDVDRRGGVPVDPRRPAQPHRPVPGRHVPRAVPGPHLQDADRRATGTQ